MAASTKSTATTRPTTCAALWAMGDIANGAENCKRLPRHHGDHRSTLNVAKVAVKPARRTKSSKRTNVTKPRSAAQLANDAKLGKLAKARNAKAAKAKLAGVKPSARVVTVAGEAKGSTVVIEGTKAQPRAAANGSRPSIAQVTRQAKLRAAKAAIAEALAEGKLTANEALALASFLGR